MKGKFAEVNDLGFFLLRGRGIFTFISKQMKNAVEIFKFEVKTAKNGRKK